MSYLLEILGRVSRLRKQTDPRAGVLEADAAEPPQTAVAPECTR